MSAKRHYWASLLHFQPGKDICRYGTMSSNSFMLKQLQRQGLPPQESCIVVYTSLCWPRAEMHLKPFCFSRRKHRVVFCECDHRTLLQLTAAHYLKSGFTPFHLHLSSQQTESCFLPQIFSAPLLRRCPGHGAVGSAWLSRCLLKKSAAANHSWLAP